MKPSRNKNSRGVFMKNAAILTVTSLILRAAGMYFRIYVSALVGAEGMGLYQLIISVYVLVSGFASSGIVVAVTRMTADEMVCGSVKTVRLVLRKCLMVSLAMGMISAILTASLAEPIGSGWLSDPRSVSSVRIMALSLPFMSISCCLRGYFTARRRVAVPSIAQIIEQGARIFLALILLNKMAPSGAEGACIAIMLADVISEGAGCLYIICGYIFDRFRLICPQPHLIKPQYEVGKKIWSIAAPITASHYLTTLLRTIESILVPDCLTAYELSRTRALELFGMVKGMALPLILFPSTLLTAFSSLLVPEISEAATLGQKTRVEEAVKRTMHITLTLSMIIGGLFLVYSVELSEIIYKETEVAFILRWLAPLLPLMYIESVTVGILRGLGEQNSSLRYGIADSALRIILIIIAVPQRGLTGFMVVMTASNLLTPLLHMRRLHRVTGLRFEWSKWLIKPFFAAVFACILTKLCDNLIIELPVILRLCAGGTTALIIYCIMLFLLGCITPEELCEFTNIRRAKQTSSI